MSTATDYQAARDALGRYWSEFGIDPLMERPRPDSDRTNAQILGIECASCSALLTHEASTPNMDYWWRPIGHTRVCRDLDGCYVRWVQQVMGYDAPWAINAAQWAAEQIRLGLIAAGRPVTARLVHFTAPPTRGKTRKAHWTRPIGDTHYTACMSHLVRGEAIEPATVPDGDRCQANGCRQRWVNWVVTTAPGGAR